MADDYTSSHSLVTDECSPDCVLMTNGLVNGSHGQWCWYGTLATGPTMAPAPMTPLHPALELPSSVNTPEPLIVPSDKRDVKTRLNN